MENVRDATAHIRKGKFLLPNNRKIFANRLTPTANEKTIKIARIVADGNGWSRLIRIAEYTVSAAPLMSNNTVDTGLPAESPRIVAIAVTEESSVPALEVAYGSSAATAEVANTITHGLGFLLSVLAAVVLIGEARSTDTWPYVACVVYLATMVAVYAASTASHAVSHPRLNHFFRMLDQGCIFLFIAGSFTPVAAIFLRDGAWWALLAAMWGIAAAGFVSKLFWQHRIDCASVAIPVLLGWLPLVCAPAIIHRVPTAVLYWMLAGGACYMLGTIFLINDRRHRYLHAVWHLWVIAGSACQFWAIFQHALPAA